MFWKSFSNSMGCEPLSFFAWNTAGSVGIEIAIQTLPQGETQNQLLSIEDKDAYVLVETGQKIPTNFCVRNISQIPVAHVYEAISGQIRLKIAQQENGTVQQASVLLEDVVIVEPKSGREHTISGLRLRAVDLQKRR